MYRDFPETGCIRTEPTKKDSHFYKTLTELQEIGAISDHKNFKLFSKNTGKRRRATFPTSCNDNCYTFRYSSKRKKDKKQKNYKKFKKKTNKKFRQKFRRNMGLLKLS